jgi:hypothetical protein
VWSSNLSTLASAPIIYSLVLPLLLLDAWVTIYQWTCFPLLSIARVARRDYFAIDRHRLPYLNALEKAHCFYCSYANGLLAYVREVAARTEQYWCPLQHQRRPAGTHARYGLFAAYGDAAGYRYLAPKLREALEVDERRRGDAARRKAG